MPGFEKANGKVVKADVSRGPVLARRGAMLAYTGDVRSPPPEARQGIPGFGGMSSMVGMAGRMLSGEHVAMMAAEGTGEVHYGHRGSHITIIELNGNELLQVEADRLLCHDANLQSAVVVLGSGGVKQAIRGAVSGQGLATTQLSGMGSVAVLSHGGTFTIAVTPGQSVAVDPQAYVAALGALTVEMAASVGWRDAVGRGSGEAIQLKVTGGGTVFVQASERKLLAAKEETVAPTILTPMTLPFNDNVNPYAFCFDLSQPWFTRKGAMIAYYGTANFEALAVTNMSALVAQRFSSPLYAHDWVVVSGQGKVIIGDRGYDINSYDLEEGNLTIRAGNLLGFEMGLELKQSIVPGFLTLIGTGKFLASSNGPVIFGEPPMRVDPEALLGWADCPSPSHHYDARWMQGFLGAAAGMVLGQQSGEERQFDFTGTGTILLQSSEQPRHDPALVKLLESQLHGVNDSGLAHLQRVIQQRLQPN